MFIFSEDKFYFNVRATLCLVNTMYGGKFLANGADTCVYDPPVSCDPPTPGMDVQNKVSRIVSLTSGEREKQVLVQKVLKDIEPVFPRIRDSCVSFCRSYGRVPAKVSLGHRKQSLFISPAKGTRART